MANSSITFASIASSDLSNSPLAPGMGRGYSQPGPRRGQQLAQGQAGRLFFPAWSLTAGSRDKKATAVPIAWPTGCPASLARYCR